MKSIFISGTAGSGKSLLTSKLMMIITQKMVHLLLFLNLDPGVENLPYTCDVDVRDYVDIVSIMQQYDLGPNGALVMANDLIASKIDDIQNEVNRVNPDYLIVDTPGQNRIICISFKWTFSYRKYSIRRKNKHLSF